MRTTVILERELVEEASRVLATHGTTQTLHAALRDVIRRARLRRLAERDLPDLTPDAVAEMRRRRS